MTQPTITPHMSEEHERGTRAELPGDVAARERVPLAMSFEELLGADDSPEETADDIIGAIREWRDTPSNRGLD